MPNIHFFITLWFCFLFEACISINPSRPGRGVFFAPFVVNTWFQQLPSPLPQPPAWLLTSIQVYSLCMETHSVLPV